MFGTSKKTLHTSILINDQVIRYVVMHMDNQGMYVVHHDEAHLPKGVVVVGEVLKARILGDILSMIHKKIVSVLKEKKIRARNEYSVLLPHEHFYHTQFEVKGIAESNDSSKMLKQYLSENIDQFPWAQRYSYVHVLDGDVVHVEALPSDVYQSYTLLFKNAGFSSVKVVSDIARLGSLVEYHSTSLIVMIDEHQTKKWKSFEEREHFVFIGNFFFL